MSDVTAISVLLPLVLVVLLLWNVRRPANVRLDVQGDQLIVELRGWDVLYCVKRRIAVPVGGVEGVGVYQRSQVPTEGLRMPGTGLPGVIRAGSYGSGTTRDFWDVRNGAEVLLIQLKPGNGYRRIVLEVPDPHQAMLRLRPLLGALDWVPPVTR